MKTRMKPFALTAPRGDIENASVHIIAEALMEPVRRITWLERMIGAGAGVLPKYPRAGVVSRPVRIGDPCCDGLERITDFVYSVYSAATRMAFDVETAYHADSFDSLGDAIRYVRDMYGVSITRCDVRDAIRKSRSLRAAPDYTI